ncbi:probable serine/threonine-protein kinase PBL4 [Lolium perenne]|uniref:probable serine/threonine-protein kinase PBL4 n=1 Tax=Lolium perenne TaxID=4522 RepID=UPI0021F64FF5|nr:probable serine/threonine-protein kinase PBL4 [Lolium perenne]
MGNFFRSSMGMVSSLSGSGGGGNEGMGGRFLETNLHEFTLAIEESKATGSSSDAIVAIKRLNEAEIIYLGGLEHSKVVSLLSHYGDDTVLLHVYEYMEKGSLENHLFKRGSVTLSWNTRLTIAIAAARGLAFLHVRDVIYRYLKS